MLVALKVAIRGTKFDLEKVKYFCQISCNFFGNCWTVNDSLLSYFMQIVWVCALRCVVNWSWTQISDTNCTNKKTTFMNVMKNAKTGNKILRKSKSYKKNKKQLKHQGPQDLNMNRPEPGAGITITKLKPRLPPSLFVFIMKHFVFKLAE